MKRKLALLCIMIMGMVITFGLTGCSGNGTEKLVSEGNTGKSEPGNKTHLIFLRNGTESDKKAYWNKMIERFQKENPDIEIEYQESPTGDDFETKLNVGFASGTAPDIINFTMASMGTRVPLGQYASLDEYVKDWEGTKDFMENALNLGKINGVTYGIPVFPDPRILIYNKELFEKAGLDPETPPTTWDELLDYHKKLVKKDGDTVVQTGFAMPTSGSSMQHYFSIFMEENGVKNLVDEDDNTILCNTPEAIEAAEFMKQIKDAGIISWDCSNGEQNPFGTGLAAMTIGTDQDFKKWEASGLKGKIAMAAPLKNTKQATFCGMSFMFMSGETEKKDAVWKFIEYVSNAENMWTRYEDLGTTPVRKSLENKFVAADPKNNAIIFDSINCGTGSPKVAYANSVYNIINDSMERIMYEVDTPENVLNAAAKSIQEEVDNQ
ncbi:ABC transporter substrate-binding protein [Anaerocolumna sp. MB42-C2]|uniref:ABC transporter substrate-binding protein n=1 Tax=Anaerocolumna sp. MB42-C2 TaxID=3070997 RepID=UPI0027E00AB4|nr:ABC transporter substrate-binding protein [Anaerocolumna sp. MB42-C2]WMJ89773.1 ABC transporter substrate-binding protein [Anaerocolumna sp. MB42-C2]